MLLSSLVGVFAAYQKDRWGEKPRLTNRALAGEYCTALFARQQVESIVLICLDVHKTVIAAETLMRGTVDETPLYPRSVVECALRHPGAFGPSGAQSSQRRAHAVARRYRRFYPGRQRIKARGDRTARPYRGGGQNIAVYMRWAIWVEEQLHPVGGYRRAADADGSLRFRLNAAV